MDQAVVEAKANLDHVRVIARRAIEQAAAAQVVIAAQVDVLKQKDSPE